MNKVIKVHSISLKQLTQLRRHGFTVILVPRNEEPKKQKLIKRGQYLYALLTDDCDS